VAHTPYREIAFRDSTMHETYVLGISDIPISDSSQVTDTCPPRWSLLRLFPCALMAATRPPRWTIPITSGFRDFRCPVSLDLENSDSPNADIPILRWIPATCPPNGRSRLRRRFETCKSRCLVPRISGTDDRVTRAPSQTDGSDLLSGFRDFRDPGSHDLENSDFPMAKIPTAIPRAASANPTADGISPSDLTVQICSSVCSSS
jgi:hypothetical protein